MLYAYVCMYVHVCIHTYMYMYYIHTCTYIHVCTYMYLHSPDQSNPTLTPSRCGTKLGQDHPGHKLRARRTRIRTRFSERRGRRRPQPNGRGAVFRVSPAWSRLRPPRRPASQERRSVRLKATTTGLRRGGHNAPRRSAVPKKCSAAKTWPATTTAEPASTTESTPTGRR